MSDAGTNADDPTTRRIRRALAGERGELSFVVERFDACLLAAARHHMGSSLGRQIDAEDVVAETWAVFLGRMGEIRLDGPSATRTVLAFLTTTLRHIVSNHLRRNIRRLKDEPPQVETPSGRCAVDRLPADMSAVTARIRRSETHAMVRAAIDGLDADDRALVVLRGFEGVGNADAAAALRLDSGVAAQRYHRALKRLRAAIGAAVFADLE